jgi:hypothetical protein
MAIVHVNVLHIQLPKYHDNDDFITHIWQLVKVCVTNGEDIDDHKLQYFPNFLRGKIVDRFTMYETAHLVTRWAFINRFNEICIEG